jgi:hypothetical protein
MEDPEPLRRKFGTVLDIPIIADLKVGRHWGDSKEVEDGSLIFEEDRLRDWMEKNHPAYQLTAA